MSLYDVLKNNGYTFRQHLGETDGWGYFAPTVVDLDREQRGALEACGMAGLKARMERGEHATFPAMDIRAPLPIQPDVILARDGEPATVVIAPRDNEDLAQIAQELTDAIEKTHGIRLPLRYDDDVGLDELDRHHMIVVGGSHQNHVALALALRYQTFFIDAAVPGDDGWAATVHTGFHATGRNVAQIVAPPEHKDAALNHLLALVEQDDQALVLRSTHRIEPGRAMKALFPSWETFVASLPNISVRLHGLHIEHPHDIPGVADLLAEGLDSGGIEKSYYNLGPILMAVSCARHYQVSADPRSLRLFRELLIRLIDYYLKKPGGACYPADLDFALGALILHYARLEHTNVFSDDDRWIIASLLLACTRSIHEYANRHWPVELNEKPRHNHETFPALSLAYAASYYRRLGITDVDTWLVYSQKVFGGTAWKRSKNKENSFGYEAFVPLHAAQYHAFTGQGPDLFEGGQLRRMTERQMAATDNFFRAVDYGDSAVTFAPVDSMIARFTATREKGNIRWYAGEGLRRKPEYICNSNRGFLGLHLTQPSTPLPAGAWELQPLDPIFIADFAPGFPGKLAFDKLAFRTGWTDDDHYLLFEGVGNEKVSHAHMENNGIVRLNHLGRHWIVSNGYGKLVGLTNSSKAFSSRIVGPEDHNVLVLTRDGEIVRRRPCCNARLQIGQEGSLLYFTGAMMGYGGVNWFRTLVVQANAYVLVIDRIQVTQAGLDKAHVEWNGLGQALHRDDGVRLDQQGIFMDVTSPSGWGLTHDVADRSESWYSALQGTAYPYAEFPLAKLVFTMPQTNAGRTECLTTLFAATRSEPRYTVAQPERGYLTVSGDHAALHDLAIHDGDLNINVDPTSCRICFAETPAVPEDLRAWTEG